MILSFWHKLFSQLLSPFHSDIFQSSISLLFIIVVVLFLCLYWNFLCLYSCCHMCLPLSFSIVMFESSMTPRCCLSLHLLVLPVSFLDHLLQQYPGADQVEGTISQHPTQVVWHRRDTPVSGAKYYSPQFLNVWHVLKIIDTWRTKSIHEASSFS